jgi:cytochrome c oxidase cbb3-type subunit 3
VRAGHAVFEANCVPCHGADARGNQSLGVPNLTDRAWINGSDWTASTRWSTTAAKARCRRGRPPVAAERKLLCAYVLDLGRPPQ